MTRVKWAPEVLIENMGCCKSLGVGSGCVGCGEHTHFTVSWLIPGKTDDGRPVCSVRCALALKAKKD